MSREMKDSGIPWLGEIPSQWHFHRFKYSGVFQKGKLPKESNTEGVGLPIIGASEMLGKQFRIFSSESDLPKCCATDTLILWDGANAGIVATNLIGIISSTAVGYSSTDNSCYHKYVFYLLKGFETYFRDKVFGTTIPHMNLDYINEIPLLVPSLYEQQAIADYLDKKCSEIDKLISLQEKFIEELKAYKQSVITEAVTKGLNPDVEMKDSSVEWIGNIPSHWKLMKIKHLAVVVRGGSPRPAGDERYYVGNIPFMKVGDITKDDNVYVNECEYSIKEEGIKYTRMIEEGTVLLTNSGATLGVPKITSFSTTINDGIAAFLSLSSIIDSVFLYYVLKSLTTIFLELSALGIGQPNLNTDIIGNTLIAIPMIKEQKQIIEFLKTKCSEIDSLISLKQSKIESLKEYKKSIIYEYVTGKKEING